MEPQENETKYILEDIEVDTVGIVPLGANGETFFLLKSKEAGMDDNFTLEEVPATDPTPSPKLWQRLTAYVDSMVAKATMTKQQKIAEAAKTLGISAKDLGKALAGMMGEEDEDEMEMGGKEKAQKEDDVSDTLTKSIDDKLAEIQKAQEAKLNATIEAIEKQYQNKLEELTTQVAKSQDEAQKAKEEVAKATEARERREWIEKADRMSLALPVDRDKLAGFLYEVSKAIPEQVEWLTTTLKTADHAMTQAGLFNEIGTSRTPEKVEPVEKAQQIAKEKNIPLAEALLQLSPEEQRAIAGGFLGDGGKK